MSGPALARALQRWADRLLNAIEPHVNTNAHTDSKTPEQTATTELNKTNTKKTTHVYTMYHDLKCRANSRVVVAAADRVYIF